MARFELPPGSQLITWDKAEIADSWVAAVLAFKSIDWTAIAAGWREMAATGERMLVSSASARELMAELTQRFAERAPVQAGRLAAWTSTLDEEVLNYRGGNNGD
jgi:hypothetical protein